MRSDQKNGNGYGGVKVVGELNQYIEPEKREGQGGVTGERQGPSEVDEGEDANSRRSASSVQVPVETTPRLQSSQGQSQRRICWDRYLPIGSPKVLLVESDDSTRHVVTALLRNCSYKVTAVSNGIEAWRVLEDLNNQIDLVLTEVVMSGLSGIGLLSKIMSHQSCQNTPVIMMSSLSSMGLVFKCLSKGAADFLVKPIRKNELTTLWQHLWRRCHTSCGSGGESCIRYEKSVGAKCAEQSNNDTASNNEDDSRSIGLEGQNGCDEGSGTQSSWTKRVAEVENPQLPSTWEQATDTPDSTCAQVIYPMPKAFASCWMPGAMQENEGQDNQLDNVSMGKDLEIGVPRNTDSRVNGPNRRVTQSTSADKKQYPQIDLNLNNDGQIFIEENLEMINDKPKDEWNEQAMNLPGEAIGTDNHPSGNIVSDAPPVLSEISQDKDVVIKHAEDFPSLELSLKRLADVEDTGFNVLDQNILSNSQLSALTRNNTGSNGNQGQTGNVGSCSSPSNSSEAAKQSNSDSPNQISNSSSNNNKGSTNRSFTKPTTASDRTPARLTVNGSDHSSVFQPVQSGTACIESLNAALLPENEMLNQQLKSQHHHDYHHCNFHSVQQLQKAPLQDDLSKSTSQCGSLNCRKPTVENVANCSLNGNASISNHGSNGSSAVVNAEGTNKVNDSGIAGKDGADNGSGSGVGVEQNRSAQREAALNKFRMKRKERCFDKKVRYQSRKRLADQRPRVRGQFVRQEKENKVKNADS